MLVSSRLAVGRGLLRATRSPVSPFLKQFSVPRLLSVPRIIPTTSSCSPSTQFNGSGFHTAGAGKNQDVMQRVLSVDQMMLVGRVRYALEQLAAHLKELGAHEEDQKLLKSVSEKLLEGQLFLLVIVGEFNTGKSAMMNALLGAEYLKEGVLPTTDRVEVLRYGPTDPATAGPSKMVVEQEDADGVANVYLPVESLRNICIVDTPGTNAIIERHQVLTEHFVPRSDLVLFVTSVERPFSASERNFINMIRTWGKKVICVVNKIDLLRTRKELEDVLSFVQENAKAVIGGDWADASPKIFPVSARLALKAKQLQQKPAETTSRKDVEYERGVWESSGFGPLERFLEETLNTQERFRLKLLNPLGCALNLSEKYVKELVGRRAALVSDNRILHDIHREMTAFAADMNEDFRHQKSHMHHVLTGVSERAERFFDDTIVLTRVLDLLRSKKLRASFERAVLADSTRQIEMHAADTVDWIVERNRRQWGRILALLQHHNHGPSTPAAASATAALKARLASRGTTSTGTFASGPDVMSATPGAPVIPTSLSSGALSGTSPHSGSPSSGWPAGAGAGGGGSSSSSSAGEAEWERRGVLERVRRAAMECLAEFDTARDGQRLAAAAHTALVYTAIYEGAVLTLGTLFVALATSTALSILGLLSTGALAAGGVATILPYFRSRMKRDARHRIASLRDALDRSLTTQFHQELERMNSNVEQVLRPLGDLVKGETEKLVRSEANLALLQAELRAIAHLLNTMTFDNADPGGAGTEASFRGGRGTGQGDRGAGAGA